MLKRLLRWLYRSAITGRFVSRDYAERNPATTTRELREDDSAA